jgi:hypothetical protein
MAPGRYFGVSLFDFISLCIDHRRMVILLVAVQGNILHSAPPYGVFDPLASNFTP